MPVRLKLGPGVIVAAAFIGPGTVTACTVAGASFGFALLWTLVFATVATIILQDMAARLGAGAKRGLGEALMEALPFAPLRWIAGGLVFAALAIGAAAYEAGNLAGGALGVSAILGADSPQRWLVVVMAWLAALVILSGRYRLIERALIGLVIVMSGAFAASALLVRPELGALAAGLVPQVPPGGLMTAVALVGTTIVPYNLFLHAAAARERWPNAGGVEEARIDTGVSVGLGGLVSIAILVTAASSLFGQGTAVTSAADMAAGLEPAFGVAARYLVGIGLFAAGLTSAITAPLATAFALTELAPVKSVERRMWIFRCIGLTVLAIGTAVALVGISPVQLILVAQIANGLLLPIVALFLLIVMNRAKVLGAHGNGLWSNVAGGAVLVITIGIGARLVLGAIGVLA
ncbi:MAG: Nramp family divalent metal transporter [Pseudomonadota bacterium]